MRARRIRFLAGLVPDQSPRLKTAASPTAGVRLHLAEPAPIRCGGWVIALVTFAAALTAFLLPVAIHRPSAGLLASRFARVIRAAERVQKEALRNFVRLKSVGPTGLALWRGPYFSGYCGAIRTALVGTKALRTGIRVARWAGAVVRRRSTRRHDAPTSLSASRRNAACISMRRMRRAASHCSFAAERT